MKDEVIRAMADIIRSGIRVADIAARFGGEEFVFLLRDADETAATVLADRLRVQIATTLVASLSSADPPGTGELRT